MMKPKNWKDKLKPIDEVCPNCVGPLIYQSKLIAGKHDWFICEKCGYRVQPSHPDTENYIRSRATSRIKTSNSHNKFKEL